MQPGTYNLEGPSGVYRGDYYHGSVIPMFSLVPWGGPSNPCASGYTRKAEVKARKNSSSAICEFTVEIVDQGQMEVRLTMEPEDTEKITRKAYWDLQVTETATGRHWTPFAGYVEPAGQVTE